MHHLPWGGGADIIVFYIVCGELPLVEATGRLYVNFYIYGYAGDLELWRQTSEDNV